MIHDKLEHGAELMFEEAIGISEDAVQNMITTKSLLNVFRSDELRDSAKPNYGCKEIMEEALRMISGSAAQHDVGADEVKP